MKGKYAFVSEPARRYDCESYDGCLNEFVRSSRPGPREFPCTSCKRFRLAKLLLSEENIESYLALLEAIFYKEINEMVKLRKKRRGYRGGDWERWGTIRRRERKEKERGGNSGPNQQDG